MNLLNKKLLLISILLFISFLIYFAHYLLYHSLESIISGSLINLAVTPIEILVLTFLINRLLNEHEKHNKLEKLNMVFGTFFSEIGLDLIKLFSSKDLSISRIQNQLIINQNWTDKDFKKVKKVIQTHLYEIEIHNLSLTDLQNYLKNKRDFLLRLLENPNLLEHETFTDLLRSVFHLTEELINRKNLNQLTEQDLNHIKVDIKRVYLFIVTQWLYYMQYLKKNYPYLFSFAMRTNPFDPDAHIEIKN